MNVIATKPRVHVNGKCKIFVRLVRAAHFYLCMLSALIYKVLSVVRVDIIVNIDFNIAFVVCVNIGTDTYKLDFLLYG